jgi:hypothetical protein
LSAATSSTMKLIVVVILAATGYACTARESDFFAPEPVDSSILPDVDAPLFSTIKPVATATILNSNVLSFTVDDATGSNGAPASGLEETSVSARLGSGTAIPLTATGATYAGSLASISDGAMSITISATDKAGNTRNSTLNFRLDRTAPLIGFTNAPPAQTASSADSILMSIGGTVSDGLLASGQLTVTQPGGDGICGNGDDQLLAKGNAAGQVSENTFDLTTQLQANATFAASFFAYNAASPGSSQTAIYCGTVVAVDAARDENGVAKGNRGTGAVRAEISWQR